MKQLVPAFLAGFGLNNPRKGPHRGIHRNRGPWASPKGRTEVPTPNGGQGRSCRTWPTRSDGTPPLGAFRHVSVLRIDPRGGVSTVGVGTVRAAPGCGLGAKDTHTAVERRGVPDFDQPAWKTLVHLGEMKGRCRSRPLED